MSYECSILLNDLCDCHERDPLLLEVSGVLTVMLQELSEVTDRFRQDASFLVSIANIT
jgi:hypothetical protein